MPVGSKSCCQVAVTETCDYLLTMTKFTEEKKEGNFESPLVMIPPGKNTMTTELTRTMASLTVLYILKIAEVRGRLIKENASHGLSQVDMENIVIDKANLKNIQLSLITVLAHAEICSLMLVEFDYRFEWTKQNMPLPRLACLMQIFTGWFHVVRL